MIFCLKNKITIYIIMYNNIIEFYRKYDENDWVRCIQCDISVVLILDILHMDWSFYSLL